MAVRESPLPPPNLHPPHNYCHYKPKQNDNNKTSETKHVLFVIRSDSTNGLCKQVEEIAQLLIPRYFAALEIKRWFLSNNPNSCPDLFDCVSECQVPDRDLLLSCPSMHNWLPLRSLISCKLDG